MDGSVEVKAATFKNGLMAGKITSQKFNIHKAAAKKVEYLIPNNEKFNGKGEINLVNSIQGSKNFTDGNWQGWYGNNMEVVIDLEEITHLHRISVGALQNSGSWIFLPKKVKILLSKDGKSYQLAGESTHNISPIKGEIVLKNFEVTANHAEARYVKVIAENIGTCPKEHMGAGKPAWMFIDEIEVE